MIMQRDCNYWAPSFLEMHNATQFKKPNRNTCCHKMNKTILLTALGVGALLRRHLTRKHS